MNELFQFSDGQTPTSAAVSSNVWNLGGATGNSIIGWLNIKVGATAATDGTEGITISLCSDSDGTFAAPAYNNASTDVLVSKFFKVGELKAGATFSIGVCAYDVKQYIAVWYGTVSTNLATFTVDAWFSDTPAVPFNKQVMEW